MRDVWISDALDEQISELLPESDIALHLTGSLKTKGVYRWGQLASRNLGQGWTVDGDAEISLYSPVDMDSQPLFCLAGPAKSVTGITVRGNHSILADGWRGSLRTGGVLLEGDGSIDRVTFRDFGSHGAESFMGVVAGGTDEASITNCLFTDFVPSASDTQVTVFLIEGERSFGRLEGNEVRASGEGNWVQGYCIYQASKGLVRGNKTAGARTGYYGDFWKTKGITIEENQFLACEHGVQLKLSPTPPEIAWNFSHEDYTIALNKIESSGANVSIDTVGPVTATRYIRNIAVHSSLSLENFGGEVTRFGDVPERKGCNPFRFLHR